VSADTFIDELGTPYITAADNLATDLLPLLDITSLFNGLSTSLSSLLSDLTNLPDLSTLLSELANLPTATDIANAIISDLTGTGGVLTTIETDLTNLPSTITTDLLNALTGSGDPLSVITTDLGNISSELGPIATALQELITAGGLTTVLGL
jgi:phage-related protein